MSAPPRRRAVLLNRLLLERLQGRRLLVRRPGLDDCRAIFSYASNPLASRFLGWQPHRDEGDTRAFIRVCRDNWVGSERFAWVIEREGGVVGMIEAKLRGRNAGIGYVLSPEVWGQGYATEALRVVSDALFCHSPVSAIWALCVTANPASARVLEKCGYQREALLPGYFPCRNLGGEKRDVWRYVRYRERERPA